MTWEAFHVSFEDEVEAESADAASRGRYEGVELGRCCFVNGSLTVTKRGIYPKSERANLEEWLNMITYTIPCEPSSSAADKVAPWIFCIGNELHLRVHACSLLI